jgi:hypothetical protein
VALEALAALGLAEEPEDLSGTPAKPAGRNGQTSANGIEPAGKNGHLPRSESE